MQELRGKAFKSGNSVALRLPKALGFHEGDDVIITHHDDGSFSVRLRPDPSMLVDELFGSFSQGFMAEGRGDMSQRDRDWDKAGPVRQA